MKLSYTIFGESHGSAIGVVLENLPSGIFLDNDFIAGEMTRRRAKSDGLTTSRVEADSPEIVSGAFCGKTTGTPLCAFIKNGNTRSDDYAKTKDLARPSHADFTGLMRYCGHNDYRGGGHFSGRLTAPLVFAGAVAKLALKERGITVGAHILQLGTERDTSFDPVSVNAEELSALAEKPFAVLDEAVGQRMQVLIQEARMNLTSIGGSIQCAVVGLPGGIGSPGRDSMESLIARNIFAVPAVKGIEFGLGFGFAERYGHEVNDELYGENGVVKSYTNHNGGILGGITSGMPVLFQVVIKPTPSISRPQRTVNLQTLENEELVIHGRHDPCILTRASVVVEAATALAVLEAVLDARGGR